MSTPPPREHDYPPLMLCQIDALQRYASKHGPRWKEHLQKEWGLPGMDPRLSRLRQTHGWLWLRRFRLPR
jgi:hypothetical protein